MVKLLPMHHPVQIIEDMSVVDNLTNGRLDFGVGRGVASRSSTTGSAATGRSRGTIRRCRSASSATPSPPARSAARTEFYDFPTIPMSTKPVQKPIPFWYPGSPVTAGRHGMSLMWPGPIDQAAYDVYVETWNAHKATPTASTGPDSVPRVGCTMVLAIAPTENEALEIARRGMERADAPHPQRAQLRSPRDLRGGMRRRAGPAAGDHGHMEHAISSARAPPARSPSASRLLLQDGMSDYICFMLPAGDMSLYEARRTLDLFVTEVKPQLDQVTASAERG